MSSSSTGCSLALQRDLSVRSEPRPAPLPSHEIHSPPLPEADIIRRTSLRGEFQPLSKGIVEVALTTSYAKSCHYVAVNIQCYRSAGTTYMIIIVSTTVQCSHVK